ncbi:hypothetical protein [Pseudodesulfovibrio senegalensis]|uniref:Uncharacterized protein n=1 Tax=Pseudodesulfovibrio senegalensis TaxID=1721087 RepID=A0A6N6MYH1_9BACT|nr:hypothetical protein [Pseudodesulfovibrio senegalensis]KAB1440306.1 hypothetical protein F8A88_13730 [Pseudodesulfovibrio senegalensis]
MLCEAGWRRRTEKRLALLAASKRKVPGFLERVAGAGAQSFRAPRLFHRGRGWPFLPAAFPSRAEVLATKVRVQVCEGFITVRLFGMARFLQYEIPNGPSKLFTFLEKIKPTFCKNVNLWLLYHALIERSINSGKILDNFFFFCLFTRPCCYLSILDCTLFFRKINSYFLNLVPESRLLHSKIVWNIGRIHFGCMANFSIST